MAKKTTPVVQQALDIIGATNVRQSRNAHGPTMTFDLMGMEWEYGFDGSPKAEYSIPKTLKGVMHMMLSKAASRRISQDRIYEVFKNGHHATR